MSNALPKEKQSAYERWELASFGEDIHAVSPAQAAQSKLTALVSQQVDALRDAAQQEGRQAGYAAGYAEGRAAGIEAGRGEAAAQAAALRALAQAFSAEIAAANDVMAGDLLDLGLDLAKAMLKTALPARPELVLPVIGDAIRYLPSVQQPAILYLHPQDVSLVREHMEDELEKSGWRIAEDQQLARGGCRVETASNQIDAAIESRWQRIAAALGRNADWLA
jgi:flagellar assembly protein FliH